LYYHQSNQNFIFASEVRTLLQTGLVPRKADPTGVLSYLEFGSVYEPWTIVEGVMAVPAGHVLTVGDGSGRSRESGNPRQAVSRVLQEEEFNEGRYSREVARRFGTEHQEIPVSQKDTLAVLPEALCAMDQPTIDGINTYLVSAKTRSAGVKVALTGLGADEMF